MRTRIARLASLVFTLCATLIPLAPSEAGAVTFRLCECSTSTPDFNPGDTLTLGLRIEGDPGEDVYGAGISVYGFDNFVVAFREARSVPSIFHAFALPAVGAFDGLENIVPTPLSESSGTFGRRVQLFVGNSVVPRNYNPLDPGLDGIVGGGDAQIRITFIATGAGVATLSIGAGYPGDGIFGPGAALLPSNTIRVEVIPGYAPICAIPEPGVAVLAGLGLAVLAGRRAPVPARRG